MRLAWQELPGNGKRIRVPIGTAECSKIVDLGGIEHQGPARPQPSRWDGAFSFHHPGNSCQATISESLRDKAIPPQLIAQGVSSSCSSSRRRPLSFFCCIVD
jgi:hypothetical protein